MSRVRLDPTKFDSDCFNSENSNIMERFSALADKLDLLLSNQNNRRRRQVGQRKPEQSHEQRDRSGEDYQGNARGDLKIGSSRNGQGTRNVSPLGAGTGRMQMLEHGHRQGHGGRHDRGKQDGKGMKYMLRFMKMVAARDSRLNSYLFKLLDSSNADVIVRRRFCRLLLIMCNN